MPGTSTVAAAAVADGTERSATPALTDTAKAVPAEKTEGDATEYAPVSQGTTAPGVAPAAAAAISDGTEDPTLADEPAVQMMQQHDAQVTEAAPVTATEDATTTETPATTSDKVTDTEAPAAAEKKDLAPVPETRKKSEIRDVSPGTADPKSKVLGPSAAGNNVDNVDTDEADTERNEQSGDEQQHEGEEKEAPNQRVLQEDLRLKIGRKAMNWSVWASRTKGGIGAGQGQEEWVGIGLCLVTGSPF